MSQFIIESSKLIKGMISSPITELNRVKEGQIPKNIINFVFIITMLVTLAKVPFREWGRMGEGLPNRYLTEIANFLSHPFILWIAGYVFYLVSILIIIKLCKSFTMQVSCIGLPYLFMSISCLGIVAQILFIPLNYLLSRRLLMTLGLFFRFWNIVLIILAVKISSSLSTIKSMFIVVVTVLIMTVFTFGIGTFLDPYLFFLF